MSGDVRALLDQLDQAREKATTGPWDAEICEGELTVSAGSARTAWTERDGFRIGNSPSSYRSTDRIYEQDLDDWDGGQTLDDQQREADADLIVAAVNHLPRLTAALRAVADLADELDREARDIDTDANPAVALWEAEARIRAALAPLTAEDQA